MLNILAIVPHPLFRALVALFMLVGLASLFATLFIFRLRRREAMENRLRSIEEKIDKMAATPR